MEITELIEDYLATKLLSNMELDFLEVEHWDIIQHISEINSLAIAPASICEKLDLDEKSCWQLCCAAVLDNLRPIQKGKTRVENLKNFINEYNLGK